MSSASWSSSTSRSCTPRSGAAAPGGGEGSRTARLPGRLASGRRTMKSRPALARALGVTGAAVQLDEVADDGEPEPEPAVRRVMVRVGLAEAVEDVGQELGRDALARVADLRSRRGRRRPPSGTSTRPPAGVNLMAFDSRFQTTCCSRSGRPRRGRAAGSSVTVERDAPCASAAGPHRVDRRVDDRGEVDRLRARAAACR